MEDCRIFFLGAEQVPFVTGVRYDPPLSEVPVTVLRRLNLRVRTTNSLSVPRPFMVLAELSLKRTFPEHVKLPNLRMEGSHSRRGLKGKNQLVIETPDHEIYLVNRFHPLEIYHLVDNISARRVSGRGKAHCVLLKQFHLNGGKMVYLPGSQEYLGMVHIHRDYVEGATFYGSHYTQAFFTIAANDFSSIHRLGTEFCFRSAELSNDCEIIQFVSGVDLVHNDTLVIGYGVGDLEARVLTMKLNDAIATLQPYSHAKIVIKEAESILESDSEE
jgi:hypothetical protein